MISVITIKGHRFVSVAEFYDHIINDPVNYHRWVRQNITEQPGGLPIEGIDFIRMENIPIGLKAKGKGLRKDYLISMDFMKQICFSIGTKRCKDLRDWAVHLHV